MIEFSFDVTDVFSFANREEAKKYLKKEGYFGDSFGELEAAIQCKNFGSCVDLNKITDEVICFVIGTDWNDYYHHFAYGLFLPVDKVKLKDKEAEE